MCVEHDNTPTAVLGGKPSPEETSVLSVSCKDLLMNSHLRSLTNWTPVTHWAPPPPPEHQHLQLLSEMVSDAVQSQRLLKLQLSGSATTTSTTPNHHLHYLHYLKPTPPPPQTTTSITSNQYLHLHHLKLHLYHLHHLRPIPYQHHHQPHVHKDHYLHQNHHLHYHHCYHLHHLKPLPSTAAAPLSSPLSP